MRKICNYQYTLETISTIVLSPRSQNGFYRGVDFKEEDIQSSLYLKNVPKIIYPFYQYGSYGAYNPASAQYYIPGSSVKGAMDTGKITGFQVDDISIECNKHINLRYLLKVQNIPTAKKSTEEQKAMKIEKFFPNVAVEMLAAEHTYRGNFYYAQELDELFKNTRESTKIKIEQLLEKINDCEQMGLAGRNSNIESKCKEELMKMSENLHSILSEIEEMKESETILILGGYKGRMLSGKFEDREGGVFIDESTKLPYGLVRIKL